MIEINKLKNLLYPDEKENRIHHLCAGLSGSDVLKKNITIL
jgi:hypothetical protein